MSEKNAGDLTLVAHHGKHVSPVWLGSAIFVRCEQHVESRAPCRGQLKTFDRLPRRLVQFAIGQHEDHPSWVIAAGNHHDDVGHIGASGNLGVDRCV